MIAAVIFGGVVLVTIPVAAGCIFGAGYLVGRLAAGRARRI